MDNYIAAQRYAAPTAAILQAQGVMEGAAFPAGVPQTGGMTVVSMHYEGTAFSATGSVLVTIAHDPGYASLLPDLTLTGQALLGVGWLVVDGPGVLTGTPVQVTATAAARVGRNLIRFMLTNTLATPSTAVGYFGFGGTGAGGIGPGQIGRGNAPMDTYAALAKPAGYDYAGDVGGSINYPLAVTPSGIPLT